MKKRLLSLFITAVLAASTLAGCGQTAAIVQDSTEGTADVATNNEAAKTGEILRVSYPTGNIRIAINILALEKGYFAEEGVAVEPVNIGGQNALTAINGENDQLDILCTGFVPDLQAIGSGYDITVFAVTAVECGAVFT